MGKKLKIGQKFTWDVDNLEPFIKQNINDLVTQLIEESKTSKLFKVIEGIKGTQELNDIDLDFDWKDAGCDDNTPNGGATYGKKYITVGDIEILMKFCQKDLVGVLPQEKLTPGAGKENENLPFEQIIMDLLLARNGEKVETAIWKSDTNSADANLNKFNGIIKQAAADGNVIDLVGVAGQTQITSTNAYAMFAAFDADFSGGQGRKLVRQKNFAYITDEATFQDLRANILADFKNSTQWDIMSNEEGDKQDVIGIMHPLTRRKIYWVPGLDETGMVFAGLFGNMGQFYIGTDLQSDWEDVEVWYEKKDKAVYVRMTFRLGTTYRLSQNVGIFQPTAS